MYDSLSTKCKNCIELVIVHPVDQPGRSPLRICLLCNRLFVRLGSMPCMYCFCNNAFSLMSYLPSHLIVLKKSKQLNDGIEA